jgi:hypothetical protein
MIRLEGGIAFEYLAVFRDLDRDAVCAQLSYAKD